MLAVRWRPSPRQARPRSRSSLAWKPPLPPAWRRTRRHRTGSGGGGRSLGRRDAGFVADPAATAAAAVGAEARAKAGAGAAALGAEAGTVAAAVFAALAAPAGRAKPVRGALALPAGAPAVSLLRSAMFLFSSATRSAESCAARSRAILSALALPCTAPLESVSLSGDVAAGRLSSTCACTLPEAWRSAAGMRVTGRPSASLRRKSLKSRLWATMVCLASPDGTSPACSDEGTSSTVPAFSRFTLPLTKASGLACSIATSIWSSETFGDLCAAAILPAVSPGCTVTCLPPSAGGLAALRSAAGPRAGGSAVTDGGGPVRPARPARGQPVRVRRVRPTGTCAATAGAAGRRFGGSNSIV